MIVKKNSDEDLNFSDYGNEDSHLSNEMSGPVRKAIEKSSDFVLNKSLSIFEKLYTKIKINPPSFNIVDPTLMEKLIQELEIREYDEIGIENKNHFIIHLYANNIKKLDKAKKLLSNIDNKNEKQFLNSLVVGVDPKNAAKQRLSALKSYFMKFPSSNHYSANYIFAELLGEENKNDAKFFANRAFEAMPYQLEAINLLNKLEPSNILKEITKTLKNKKD